MALFGKGGMGFVLGRPDHDASRIRDSFGRRGRRCCRCTRAAWFRSTKRRAASPRAFSAACSTAFWRALPPVEDPLPEHIRASIETAGPLERHPRAAFSCRPDSDLRLLNAFRSPAQYRLIFEEFFWLECGLELKRAKARVYPGIAFELTSRVREQIHQDAAVQAHAERRNAYWRRSPTTWRCRIPCIVCCKATSAAARRWWRPRPRSSRLKTAIRWRCWRRPKSWPRSTISISKSCCRSWTTL